MKLAYVLDRFPVLSETFIAREIEGLAREGVHPDVFALGEGDGPPGRAAAAEVLPGPFSARTVAACAASVAGNPLRAADALARLAEGTTRAMGTVAAEISRAQQGFHLARELRRRSITHVHAHFGFVPSTVAWLAWRLTGIPYSVSVHAWDVFVNRSMMPDKLLAARQVVTCTEYAGQWLRRRYPALRPDRVTCVRHGVDLDEYRHAPLPGSGPFGFLAVGRLVPKKGFAHLLRALARLRAATHSHAGASRPAGDPSPTLTIVGEGPERGRLEALARELDLGPRLRMTGAVENSRVREEIGRAHVLVAPSVQGARGDRDGLPNVVIEAAASGRAVIGSRFSGIPEGVVEGETGFLVPPGDEAALAERMTRLARDPGLAARMGAAGRRFAEREFSLEKSAKALAAILRRLA